MSSVLGLVDLMVNGWTRSDVPCSEQPRQQRSQLLRTLGQNQRSEQKLTVKALPGPLVQGAKCTYWFWEGDRWMYSMSVSAIQTFWTSFACWHFTMTWVFAQALTQLLTLGRTVLQTRGKQWGGRRRKYLLSRAIIYHFQTVRQDKE